MRTTVDKINSDHLHEVDVITERKRVVAFMVDKVMELHRAGDAVAWMVMSKKGE